MIMMMIMMTVFVATSSLSLQFTKDDERVKLVSAGDDYEEDGDVCDLEISNYSDKSAANGGSAVNGYRDDASAAYPSWIASLDEFRYDAFNIKEKSRNCVFLNCCTIF